MRTNLMNAQSARYILPGEDVRWSTRAKVAGRLLGYAALVVVSIGTVLMLGAAAAGFVGYP